MLCFIMRAPVYLGVCVYMYNLISTEMSVGDTWVPSGSKVSICTRSDLLWIPTEIKVIPAVVAVLPVTAAGSPDPLPPKWVSPFCYFRSGSSC